MKSKKAIWAAVIVSVAVVLFFVVAILTTRYIKPKDPPKKDPYEMELKIKDSRGISYTFTNFGDTIHISYRWTGEENIFEMEAYRIGSRDYYHNWKPLGDWIAPNTTDVNIIKMSEFPKDDEEHPKEVDVIKTLKRGDYHFRFEAVGGLGYFEHRIMDLYVTVK